MDKLNDIIKIDLHIHSNKSKYKESDGIVDDSTIDKLPVLFNKLNDNGVALFSITDHNRFDTELYKEIKRILKEDGHHYSNVKNVLAGVEFDVKIEENMGKCHIITIFDTKDDSDFEKIEKNINEKLLERPDDYYNKNDFEQLLKNINLNVILIACQRKNLDNHDEKNASLSDTCQNPEEIIKVGYINALEFQKSKVEGILINNLRNIDIEFPLVSGSDCHDWKVYPKHDASSQVDFKHTKAKILPTFKGLLMAITSPKTRFNRMENNNLPIKNIIINGENIPLTSGLNVIIGENGSGKTTLLEEISDIKKSDKYIKDIVKDNAISHEKGTEILEKKYIKQGEIIRNFYSDNLFKSEGDSVYLPIDNKEFEDQYGIYQRELLDLILENINREKNKVKLRELNLEYKEIVPYKNYYIMVSNDLPKDMKNAHCKPLQKVASLIRDIKYMLGDEYFSAYRENIEKIYGELSKVFSDITNKYNSEECKIEAYNVVNSALLTYKNKITSYLTTEAKESDDYRKKKDDFISSIIETIQSNNKNIVVPVLPSPIKGVSKNKKGGFCFNNEANYNEKDVIQEFFNTMFTKQYRDIEQVKSINSNEIFDDAVMNQGKVENVKDRWLKNFNSFMEKEKQSLKYISDDSGSKKIGNTLGEMSLAYYKYCTQDGVSNNLLMVDQPEDNISNSNIRKNLIVYFDYLRQSKQIIFVTHNPLLVVNLDVDNVIYLKNDGGKIKAVNGCLEYENKDQDINILNIIADNMDGGKETIERRLKVYGNSY